MDNRTFTNLPLTACGHFLELPDSRIDCSLSNPNFCVRCTILGRFGTGGSLHESGTGHVITVLEWILTLFIGLCGVVTNCLIITIIRRQNTGRSFDILLTALACIDLIGSFMSVVASTTTIGVYQGWNRGISAQYMFYIATMTSLFARSCSAFMTVLITAERYLVISFPITASHWFTSRKTVILAVIVVIFSAFTSYPRYASLVIAGNEIGHDIPSMMDYDHMILASSQLRFWYMTTRGFFDKIDFWVPLPVLLILNILIYIEIRKFSRRRKEMNLRNKQEIQAVKMFLPVIVVLFLCNIEPYAHYYYIAVPRLLYREHFMGVLLSIAVNSFVNFFFYMRAESFKKEFRDMFGKYFGWGPLQFLSTTATAVNDKSGVQVSVERSKDSKEIS